MRSLKRNLVFTFLLALIGLSLIPGALALNQVIKPLSSEPANMAYSTETGLFYDNLFFLPLVKDEATAAGIMFHGLNVSQDAYISQANLTLRFCLMPQAGQADLTVFGIKSRFGQNHGFYSSADLLTAELTENHLDLDLSNITSDGFYTWDITAIVQEIINREVWETLDNVGLVFYSAGGTPRAVSTNSYLENWFPYINVTSGEGSGQAADPFQYEGYTIVHGETSDFTGFITGRSSYPGNMSLIYADPLTGAWVENITPYPWLQTPGGADKGFTLGDTLYVVIPDAVDSADLIAFNLTESMTAPLDHYKVGNMGHTSLCGSVLKWDNEANMGHYAYVDASGIYYYNFTLNPYVISARVRVYAGYGAVSASGIDMIIDDEGRIYLAASCPDPSGSTNRVRFCYKEAPGSAWQVTTISGNAFSDSYYPQLEILDNDWVLVFNDGPLDSTSVYSYGWGDLGSGTPPTTWGAVDDATARYIHGAYADVFHYPGFYSGTQYHKDVIMIIATRTNTDYRLGYGFIYKTAPAEYNAAEVLDYGFMANYTAEDFRYPVHYEAENTIKPVFGAVGFGYYNVPYAWAGTRTLQEWGDYSLSITSNYCHYPAPVCTGSQLVYSVTPPENGTAPDPNCLAQAETLEDVIACINAALPGGVAPADDPAPPGWEETGVLSRPKMTLYYFVLGLLFVIGPPIWYAKNRDPVNIMPVLFLMFFGVMLWVAMNYI